MPTNAAEAVQLQVDNLEAASQSKTSSRVSSRIGSRIHSAVNSAVASGMHTPRYKNCIVADIIHRYVFLSLSLNSFVTFFNYLYRQHAIGVSNPVVDAAPLNMAQSNRNMTDVEDSPETLQNIMRVTRDQESVFKVVLICMKLSLQI